MPTQGGDRRQVTPASTLDVTSHAMGKMERRKARHLFAAMFMLTTVSEGTISHAIWCSRSTLLLASPGADILLKPNQAPSARI